MKTNPVIQTIAFVLLSLLLAGCATGQGGNDEAAQALSGVLQVIGQGLSGL